MPAMTRSQTSSVSVSIAGLVPQSTSEVEVLELGVCYLNELRTEVESSSAGALAFQMS